MVSFNYDSNVATSGDGDEYFYLRNLQGDITSIVDSTGAIVVEYTYDAYGNILDTDVVSGYEDIAEHNSYSYRGYRRDQETGWYYLQSRYYVSETGRFLNSDVVLGIEGSPLSNNLFSYTQNNPINYIDSNGLVRTKVYIGSAAWMQIALMCFGSGTGFWIMKLSVWGPVLYR